MFAILHLLLLLLIALAAQGCTAAGVRVSVHNVDAIAPSALAGTAKLAHVAPNPHQGVVELFGTPVHDRFGHPPTVYVLETTIDPNRPGLDDRFRFRVIGLFSKRVFLKSAFAEGRSLPTTAHDRERVDCGFECTIAETIFITVSEADLGRWAVSGVSLQIDGRRVRFTMFIPASYIRDVLARHRAERARLMRPGPPS